MRVPKFGMRPKHQSAFYIYGVSYRLVVPRVDTWRKPAKMVEHKLIGNLANQRFIKHTMGIQLFAALPDFSIALAVL